MPTQHFLERAGCWYLHSGIQEPTGGVARYYLADLHKNAAISTEISGYAISTLVYLHSRTGDEEYLDRAKRAAEFLTRTARSRDGFAMPFETGSNLTYFFDCGIIVRGLLTLHLTTGDAEALDTAVRCGTAMLEDFKATGGEYHPILTLPEKTSLPRDERWSRNPGCYQLKAALGWFELASITGEDAWMAAYEEVVARALNGHLAFPELEPQRARIMDRLHAYCYFLEGLMPSLHRGECRKALADGIALTGRLLREVAPQFARSDVYAQLLRVRLYAASLGVLPLDRVAAEEEAHAVAGFQVDSPDVRRRGGFCFGRKSGAPLPFSNPVSTAFGLQALAMWDEYQEGRTPTDPRLLI